MVRQQTSSSRLELLMVPPRKLGAALTTSDCAAARVEKQAFTDFMLEHVLRSNHKSLLVLPANTDSPVYRYRYFPSAEDSAATVQGFGFSSLVLPALLGTPACVVPIGQYPYESEFTGKIEQLPIYMTVVKSRGADVVILELAQEFLALSAEYGTCVGAGKEAFSLGKRIVVVRL